MDKSKINFNHAAFKHGVTEADIFRAFETYIFEDPVEDADNKFLLIGFDTKANPIEVMSAILIYIKLSIKSPLRDAQRDASAGPDSKKGQAFGLAFFADTRAHSVFLRAMAVHSSCGASLVKWGGFGNRGLGVQPSYFSGNMYLLPISAAFTIAAIKLARMNVYFA
jgi:hypothetical protein